MIRYRTRDLTRLLPGTARPMRRIDKITGRSDDMLIIRGVNVFPTQIEEQVLKVKQLAEVYEIHLYRNGNMDSMDVHVELKHELQHLDAEEDHAEHPQRDVEEAARRRVHQDEDDEDPGVDEAQAVDARRVLQQGGVAEADGGGEEARHQRDQHQEPEEPDPAERPFDLASEQEEDHDAQDGPDAGHVDQGPRDEPPDLTVANLAALVA